MSNESAANSNRQMCSACGRGHVFRSWIGAFLCSDCDWREDFPPDASTATQPQSDQPAESPPDDSDNEPVVHLGGCFAVVSWDLFFGEPDDAETCPFCLATGLRADGLEYCEYCEGNGDLE